MSIPLDRQPISNNTTGSQSGDLCNFGNRRNIKDAWRDAWFFPHLLASRQAAAMGATARASVKTVSHSTPLPPQSPQPQASPINLPSSLDAPVFRRFLRTYSAPAEALLRRYRAPAPWRDLSPWCATYYRHVAAQELGTAHAFTLNLSDAVEAKARLQPSAASWLLKRIARELRIALPDRDPAIWFVLEETDRRRLHLHGEIVTADPERARKALRKAAGEWEHARQHQAHTKAEPDSGWLGYALKLIGKYRNGRYAASRGFSGEPTASTQNLSRKAKRLYELDRTRILGRASASA